MKAVCLYILISLFLGFFTVGCMKSVRFIAPETSIKSFCEKGNVKCLKKEALAKRTWEVKGTPTGEVTFEQVTGENESVKVTVKSIGMKNPFAGIFKAISTVFAYALGKTDVTVAAD